MLRETSEERTRRRSTSAASAHEPTDDIAGSDKSNPIRLRRMIRSMVCVPMLSPLFHRAAKVNFLPELNPNGANYVSGMAAMPYSIPQARLNGYPGVG